MPNPSPRHLNMQVRRQRNQIFGYFDDCDCGCGKSHQRRQLGAEEFVDQDAAVLRIILEFNHVVVSVRAPHEVRLSPATHPPNVLDGTQRADFRVAIRPGSVPTQ